MAKKKSVGKKQIKKTERTNFHINEYRNSKIYLSYSKSPEYISKDDISIVSSLFTNVFSSVDTLGISERQNIICWGAEGLVVLEGKSDTISKGVAKEVSLALHLGIPVWVFRGLKFEPVYAVLKEWQGVKENEIRWASIIVDGQAIPTSSEMVHQSSMNSRQESKSAIF